MRKIGTSEGAQSLTYAGQQATFSRDVTSYRWVLINAIYNDQVMDSQYVPVSRISGYTAWLSFPLSAGEANAKITFNATGNTATLEIIQRFGSVRLFGIY